MKLLNILFNHIFKDSIHIKQYNLSKYNKILNLKKINYINLLESNFKKYSCEGSWYIKYIQFNFKPFIDLIASILNKDNYKIIYYNKCNLFFIYKIYLISLLEFKLRLSSIFFLRLDYLFKSNEYIYIYARYNTNYRKYFFKLLHKKYKNNINIYYNSLHNTYVSYYNLDSIYICYINYLYNSYNKFIYNKVDYRLDQLDDKYKFKKKLLTPITKIYGLNSIWLSLRYWSLPLIIGIFIMYFLCYIKLQPIPKILFSWFLIIMFLYWLLSGFVFFFKKYQYSKYTTAIQRFWKRTYIIFWLIESCVFLTFFYLTLNSSAEPLYMYDQARVYKTHLFSWRCFLIKLIPVISIILLAYYLLLSVKWSIINKQHSTILAITLILLYILWLEFYQIFHIINFYTNLNWLFDLDEYIWTLEINSRRTRILNNYTSICLFAKFWHLVFIFIFWVFFILRLNESGRIRYFFLTTNIQNFIILYFMSWLYMYPWLKYIFRKFYDITYFWFFCNNRQFSFIIFYNDIKLFFYSIYSLNFLYNINSKFYYKKNKFFYWIQLNINQSSNLNIKSFTRDFILNSFCL